MQNDRSRPANIRFGGNGKFLFCGNAHRSAKPSSALKRPRPLRHPRNNPREEQNTFTQTYLPRKIICRAYVHSEMKQHSRDRERPQPPKMEKRQSLSLHAVWHLSALRQNRRASSCPVPSANSTPPAKRSGRYRETKKVYRKTVNL